MNRRTWMIPGVTMVCGMLSGAAPPAQPAVEEGTDVAAAQATQSVVAEREVHVLRVEFLRGGGAGPARVIVDGEPVEPFEGQFLLRFIGRLRGQIFGRAEAEDVETSPPAAADETDPARPVGVQDEAAQSGPGPRQDMGDRGPHGWRARGSQGMRARNGDLSSEEMADMMSVIKDFEPMLYERLEDLQGTSRNAFEETLRNDAERWLRLVDLKKNDPDGYEAELRRYDLSRELFELQLRYKDAIDQGRTEEAETIRARLVEVVDEQFALEQARRESELRRTERQIQALRSRLRQREERRSEIVTDRVDRLLDFTGFDLGDFDDQEGSPGSGG